VILYQIKDAEVTLLNPQRRIEYDRRLGLFTKRRTDRQVDPIAIESDFESFSGKAVGSDSGFVMTLAALIGVICVAFAIMACYSFHSTPNERVVGTEATPTSIEERNEVTFGQEDPVHPQANLSAVIETVVEPPPQNSDHSKEAPVPKRHQEGMRVVISLPKSGAASIKVGKISDISLLQQSGEQVSVPQVTRATKLLKLGEIRSMEWTFRETKNLDFKVTDGDVHIDEGVVVMNPTNRGDGIHQANASFPLFLALPIQVSLDVEEMGRDTSLVAVISSHSSKGDRGYTEFWMKSEGGLASPIGISARWDSNNGKTVKQVIPETKASLETAQQFSFSADSAELSPTNRFSFRIGTVGKSSIRLSRISIDAVLP